MTQNEKNKKAHQKIYMPSLIYTLAAHESNKDRDLTEKEVEQICERANVMITEISQYKQMQAFRSYKDINPKNCWKEWLHYKNIIRNSMNKKYVDKLKNPKTTISAHIEFASYKSNFFSRFFSKVESELEVKFGGRPCLLDQSEWPLSKQTRQMMKFICQIRLDRALFKGLDDKLIYLFITDNINVTNTNEPDSGENAVIIKSFDKCKIKRRNLFKSKGPSLDNEYKVKFVYKEEPDFDGDDWTENQYDEYFKNVDGTKIAGNPSFLDRDMAPPDKDWRLLLQIDSSELPFDIDFGGGGVGYLFINKDCTKGKFLWQCD